MIFDSMYRTWIEKQNYMAPFQARRVFQRAIEGEDIDTVDTFLKSVDSKAEFLTLLRSINNPEMLSLWLRHCSEDEKEKFYLSTPTGELADLFNYHKRVLCSDAMLDQLWERGGDRLRLSILGNSTRYDSSEGHLDWFIAAYPFEEANFSKEQLTDALDLIVQKSYVLDKLFAKAQSVRLRVALLSSTAGFGSVAESASDELERYFLAKLEPYALNNSDKEPLLSFLEWRIHSGPSSYTSRRQLIKLIKATRAKLTGLTPEQETQLAKILTGHAPLLASTLPLTREEIELTFGADLVNDEAVEMAAREGPNQSEDSLWYKTRTHRALTPSQAAVLLVKYNRQLSEKAQDTLVEEMISGRERQWVLELAAALFSGNDKLLSRGWGFNRKQCFFSTACRLSWDEAHQLLGEIIKTEKDARRVLDVQFINQEEIFRYIPSDWVAESSELQQKVAGMVNRHLGDNPALWENFEKLGEDFSGSFIELLEVAKSI